MKKGLFVLAFLFVLSSAAFAAPLDQSKEPDGFRGIKWGEDVNNVKGLQLLRIETAAEIKTYLRKTDKMSIGDAKLQSINYSFKRDKFLGAEIEVQEKVNADALLAFLKETYGETSPGFPGMYQWDFDNVSIMYVYSNKRKSAICAYASKTYMEKLKGTP